MGDTTTLTTINALLKIQQDEFNDQFPNLSILRSQIKPKLRKRAGGGRANGVEHPMRLYPNGSFGGVRGAAGNMATSSQGGYATAILQTYPHNARAAWGHIDEIKAKSDIQTAESLIKRVTQDTMEGFALSMNRAWWRNGSGAVARINGAPTVATGAVVIDATFSAGGGYTAGFHHIGENGWYEAGSSLTGTYPNRVGKAKATAKVESTLTITFGEGSIADWADNDYIFVEDGMNNITDGLLSVYSSANGGRENYLSIDRALAANSYFKPIEHAYVDTTSKETVIIGLLMQAGEQAVKPPGMGLTSYKVVKGLWEDTVSGNRRFLMDGNSFTRKYALGFDAVGIGSPAGSMTEIFTDRHCPGDYDSSTGVMAIIEPSDFSLVMPEEAGWYKPDGNMYRIEEGTFGKYSTWVEVSSLACDMPRRQIFITALKVAA